MSPEEQLLFDDIKNRKCFCCYCQDLQQKIIEGGLDEIEKYDGMVCGNIQDMKIKYYNLEAK